MDKKPFLKRSFANFLSIVLAVSFLFNIDESYAVFDGVRDGVSYANGKCTNGNIDFDPFGGNRDVNWEITNPVCLSFMASAGAAIVATGWYAKAKCVATNTLGVVKAPGELGMDPIPDMPILNANTAYKMVYRNVFLCGARITESATLAALVASNCTPPAITPACPFFIAQAGAAASDVTTCCTATAVFLATVGVAVASIAVIYAAAKGAYDNGRVCGHDWNSWAKVNVDGDVISSPGETIVTGSGWITRRGKFPGSYSKCLDDLFVNNSNSCGLEAVDDIPPGTLSLTNKYYREYLYGGKEYTDSACKVPVSWTDDKRMKRLGYTSNDQKYYLQGPGVSGNYACRRFLLAGSVDAASNAAYECCIRRSQNTICIENAPMGGSFSHSFCEFGQKCNVAGIWFEPYPSRTEINYICAKTYSVCPYNHILGGGTEMQRFINDSNGFPTGNTENFCQFMKHCTKIPILPYIRISDLHGAFISGACRDLKGDAQNVYGFDGDILPINTRGFSAPIVQCFKETLQNLMTNKAGSTKCSNPDELPVNGQCSSGYVYREGTDLSQPSFFAKVQENLRTIIKMVLTVSITFFGVSVLLGMGAIDKKKLLPYMVKIGFVMYFALGNAWQTQFVAGVMKSSDYISSIMMKLDEDKPANKLDGCQFPKFDYADQNEQTRYDNPRYPFGKEYLKVWDILDCKLARAFGFGPDASVPNLVKMILAGFFTGGYGIVFLVAIFIFAFFILALIMRAIHIFLMATIAISLLIYVSPITITLSLFERTKGIFNNWWKQLLGFVLQPVILFAYLGIYISLFDTTMIGDVTFRGDGKATPKAIVCDDVTNNTSIYCIFKIANLKTYSGLEIIGIGIPVLTSMNKEKLDTIMKAAFIMFIFSQFMDKISKLASTLVGGAELQSNTASMAKMAETASGALRAVQKRGTRLSKRAGLGALKGAEGFAKGAAKYFGNRGKVISATSGQANKGGNRAGSGTDGANKPGGASAGTNKPGGGAAASAGGSASSGNKVLGLGGTSGGGKSKDDDSRA